MPPIIGGIQIPNAAIDPKKARKTINTLFKTMQDLNSDSLKDMLKNQPADQQAQLVLNQDQSSFTYPGLGTKNFKIPGHDVVVKVQAIITEDFTLTYNVTNLRSTSVELTYEQGGLMLTADFPDTDHALSTGTLISPDFNVKNFQLKIPMPITFDADTQYFHLGTRNPVANGAWTPNGVLKFLFDSLKKDINQKIEDGVAVLLIRCSRSCPTSLPN